MSLKEVTVFWLEDKGWMSSLSQGLFNMYQAKALCDTTLIASDGESIPCHASVLAAASPYLRKLLKAATQNFLKVNIQVSIHSGVLRQVVDFIYLGRSAAVQDQLEDLAAAAEQLDIEGLKTACSKFDFPLDSVAPPGGEGEQPEAGDDGIREQEDCDEGEQIEMVEPPGGEQDSGGDQVTEIIEVNNAASQPTPFVGAPGAAGATFSGPKNTFQCSECERKFGQMSHLQQHLRLHTGERPYSCKFCQKRFTISSNLNRHLKIHTGERPYTCKLCPQTFNQSSHLKQHERSHTGNKPYECSMCSRRFSKKSHVKRHMMLHTGKKTFKCAECPRAFTDTSHLREHMMMHTGERPHVCRYCKKSFTFKSSLVQHLRLHTGEKPYHCDTCGRDFARFQQLKEHRIVHTGDRVHECTACGAAFYLKAQYKEHMEMHMNTKSRSKFQCQVCDKVYTKEKALLKHRLKMHSSIVDLSGNEEEAHTDTLPVPEGLDNIPPTAAESGAVSQIMVKLEPAEPSEVQTTSSSVTQRQEIFQPTTTTTNRTGMKFEIIPAQNFAQASEGDAELQEVQEQEAPPGGQVLLQSSLQQQIEQTLQHVGYMETLGPDGEEQEIQVLIVEEGFEFSDSSSGQQIVVQSEDMPPQ